MTETYSIPLSVTKAAKRGLFLSEKFGLSTSSINRAQNLGNQDSEIDFHTIARMVSYFNKTEQIRKTDSFGNAKNPTKLYAEWLTWGGESGKAWSNKIWNTVKHAQEKLDDPRPNNNIITLSGTAFASADVNNPTQKYIKFVFTDYLPNVNRQGVPVEEAENIIKTGLYMPVKVNFNNGPKGHPRAIPIGPITSMRQEDDKIIGEAVIWSVEFPDVADYLDIASASEGGVQFSWELAHSESTADENGVTWLRNIVVVGITMVDNPAYKGRTPLIAVAEELTSMDLEQALADLANANDRVSELETQLGEISVLGDKITQLETELTELRNFKTMVETEAEKANVLADRRTKLSEAGVVFSDEEFDERSSIIFDMPETAFDFYVKDLARVVKNTKKMASASNDSVDITIPDPTVNGSNENGTDFKELGKALRNRSLRLNAKNNAK